MQLRKTKVKNVILAIVTSIIAIIIPSYFLNKWFEGLFFFFSHWFIREQFPKQYHHIVLAMCRLITSLVFFFGVVFIFPFNFSFLSAIPICYFISWVGFTKKQADDYEVECEKLREKYCNDKENLLLLCRNANLSKRDTEIAIKYYYEKHTPKEIWLWLCENREYESIEWDSVKQIIWRIGKKINK